MGLSSLNQSLALYKLQQHYYLPPTDRPRGEIIQFPLSVPASIRSSHFTKKPSISLILMIYSPNVHIMLMPTKTTPCINSGLILKNKMATILMPSLLLYNNHSSQFFSSLTFTITRGCFGNVFWERVCL